MQWFSDGMNISVDQLMGVKVYEDEPLPAPESVRAVIITGSVYMVSDCEPWSERTAQWLADAVAKEVPVLGVCYGHQLLAHALGGVVAQNPNNAEYGTVTVKQNELANDDVLFAQLPKELKVQAAHSESVLTLPEGAVCLGANAHDGHHIFRYGKQAWGVQFHPEYDLEIMQYIYDTEGEHLAEEGLNLAELRKNTEETPHGKALLSAFYKYVS